MERRRQGDPGAQPDPAGLHRLPRTLRRRHAVGRRHTSSTRSGATVSRGRCSARPTTRRRTSSVLGAVPARRHRGRAAHPGREPCRLRSRGRRGRHAVPGGPRPLRRADWHTQFGAAWPQLAAAQRTYDPHGMLTPGQGVF
ncbi:hypothetical protein [Streptomyces galbus]|uniref:hypothetical protein n=1 Tax=Streptomyces galbus TaxID=33898 RepID=UPI001F4F4069|nr:hypothetical protein [Streptomyces galbus]